jgi:hypothetical protein
VKAIDEGKAALSAEKMSGRPAKLTDEQWDVVAGAILLEKKKNRSAVGSDVDRG